MKKYIFGAISVVALLVVLGMDLPCGPVIVAKTSYTAQSSNIATTTLYTPSSDGDYQVVVYEVASAQFGNSQMSSTVSWTDDLQSELVGVNDGPGGTGSPWVAATFNVRATSGNPIQFASTYSAGTSNLTYDIYITVIKE